MSILSPITGLPGIGSRRNTSPRRVWRCDPEFFLSGGKIIDGSKSRDSGNTGNLDVLRPGLLMGKITSSGFYAPSILGVVTAAYTSGGTTINVSAAQAVEIVRRVGASGNLTYVGPPSAGGTVAITSSVAYSAVNTSTGDITVTSLGVNKIAGTFVTSTDGSGIPISFVADESVGIKVTDIEGNSQNTPWDLVPTGGTVDASQLLPVWPSDVSLQAWLRDQLSLYGKFMLDYIY